MLLAWRTWIPKRFVKPYAITENKIKSKKVVSPNRFQC